jgi:hypothetical protein
VQLGLRRIVLLEVGRRVWVGCRRQDKGGGGLQLVLKRRLVGRAAGQRGAVRARRVNGLELRGVSPML